MNILILGDIMGPSGREAIIKKLPNLIKKKKFYQPNNNKILVKLIKRIAIKM